MASREVPFHGLVSLFNEPNKPVYVLLGDFSYQLAYDEESGRWIFESETAMSEEIMVLRSLSLAFPYPAEVAQRVRRAAKFVEAYYDVPVDDRIGTDAFPRVMGHGRSH